MSQIAFSTGKSTIDTDAITQMRISEDLLTVGDGQ